MYFVLINFISPFCFEGKDHLPNVVSGNHRPCCIRYSKKNFSLTATVDVIQHTIDKVMYNFHTMPNIKVMKKDRSLPGDMKKGMCSVVALCRTTYFQWLCLICQKVNLRLGKLKLNYVK